MSELLYLTNFADVNTVEKTILNADTAVGAISAIAQNVQNFAINDIVVFGALASEQAETTQLSAVTISTQTFGFPALTFAHNKLEPIIKLFGDKIKIYRAANVDDTQPEDGSFALLATVTIEVKKSYTNYNDVSGGIGYWYKVTYFNSVNNNETDISESDAVRGGNYGHYATVDQVRLAAGFRDNTDIIDESIAEARDEAESIIKGYIVGAGYYLPLLPPYPPTMVRLVKQLASAYLLQNEYGASAQGTDRDGDAREVSVMKYLDKIQIGTIKLVDVNKETITPKVENIAGWPDDTTKDASNQDHGGKPKFTMSKKW